MKVKGPRLNVWTYTMLIRDHCMRCTEDMHEAGLHPDVTTYTSLLAGYGNAKRR
jgi:hypothetical protein